MGRHSTSRQRRAPRAPRSQRLLLRYGWLLPVAAIFVGAGILGLTYAFASIPLPEDIEVSSSAEVFDRDGRLIGTYSDEIRRFLIDTRKLPHYVGEAVIVAEDRNFYEHNGVSLPGIARAAWANITGGGVEQGGSTLTQQYIKNALLTPERTITRKAKEAVLAIKLEREYSKEEILGFYLNTIYLGRGAYGVEAAARTYFDKSAEELTLGEAAYFAGIIPSPESYQPDENPQGARTRRDRVLEQMEAQGYITPAQLAEASSKRIRLAPNLIATAKRQPAAYFMEWLRRDFLFPEYGNCLYTCGLKIHTTLDLDMQEQAEQAVATVLTDPAGPQAALVSMTPSGAVRALVGGRDFTNVRRARGFNFATSRPGRQAGSAFKPFTLLTALEQGISPSSRFSGASPVTISDPECETDGEVYQPENYAGTQFGTVTLDVATVNSINTVYAQLAAEVGPENIADLLGEFDFDREGTKAKRDIPAVCSLPLGTIDVTPLEMARGYAAFAGRGDLPQVQPIRFVTNRQNQCLKEFRLGSGRDCKDHVNAEPKRVAEQNSVDVMNQVMTGVIEAGTAAGADIGRPAAGKTGTTQDNVDAWFGGYVPQLATMVWMGYPREQDGTVPQMRACADPNLCRPVQGNTGVTGGSFPAEIWQAYMIEAVAELPVESFPTPADLPDEVINSPAPQPTVTEPVEAETPTAEPSETGEPEGSPSPDSSPTPTPQPSPSSSEPSVLPTPSQTGKPDGNGEDP